MVNSPTLTFTDLGKFAVSIIRDHGGLFHMVSGPITTGLTMGRPHTREENLQVFGGMIERLADTERLNMFSVMPFDELLGKLHARWRAENPAADYCQELLEEFYLPIFQTRLIEMVHFMHGYDTSRGALWEYNQCRSLGINVRMLPRAWSEEIYAALFLAASNHD